jgi:hypothetical protein
MHDVYVDQAANYVRIVHVPDPALRAGRAS